MHLFKQIDATPPINISDFIVVQTRLSLTCAVEEVGPLQDVSSLQERLSLITIHEGFCFIHLPVFHHLQPLRVVPAKLLVLDLPSPFFIILLQMWKEKGKKISGKGPKIQLCEKNSLQSGGLNCRMSILPQNFLYYRSFMINNVTSSEVKNSFNKERERELMQVCRTQAKRLFSFLHGW